MNNVFYEEVSKCLESIRDAKAVLFYHVVQESVEFLLAHSALMSALWDQQLSEIRGRPTAPANLGALHDSQEAAVERLRGACIRLIELRLSVSTPPGAPSVGI
jgi:hypothetical protein